MKPFIGNPEEKTEDRSELSKGPKEKQEVGRNYPTDTRRNRSNRQNRSSETKETKMQQKETNETVHRKPRGKQETGRDCPGGNENEAGSSGDERKRWVGFRRRLSAGAILGRPACRVANSSAANQ